MLKQPNAAGSRACARTLFLSVHHPVFLAIDRCALCKRYDRFLFRKPHFQLFSSPKSNFLIHTSFSLNTSESSTKQTQSSMSTSNEMPIAPAITATHLVLTTVRPWFAPRFALAPHENFRHNSVFGYLSHTKVVYTKKLRFGSINHLPLPDSRTEQ